MRASVFIFLIILFTALSGCVSDEQIISEEPSQEFPERLSFSAPIMNGSSNLTNFVLEEYVSDGPVLMLWVAAGCMGCHSWTDMLVEEVKSGNISNSSLLSIHRYSSFESESYVEEVYGTNNSSNPVNWPLILPSEETVVIDLDTGVESNFGFYQSFGNPSTPTLQVMDVDGKIIWSSKTYWPSADVLEAIKLLIN